MNCNSSELIKLHIIKYLGDLECLSFNADLRHNLVTNVKNLTYINYKNSNLYLKVRTWKLNVVKIYTSNAEVNVSHCTFEHLTLINFDNVKSLYITNTNKLCTNKYLNNVTKVGHNFLAHSKIKFVNLNYIPNIREIGIWFLACNQLTSIDLTPLSNVCSIELGFLHTNLLSEIDLSPLNKLSVISGLFLGYNKFTSINLKGLNSVVKIEDFFLVKNYIREIDLSPLINLRVIGDKFLKYNPIRLTLKNKILKPYK